MNDITSHDLQAWSAPQQQRVFRQLLRAFSFPGRVETLTGTAALTQTLATLVDSEATLADPQHLVDALSCQRLQTRMVSSELAQFVVADGGQSPVFEPNLGTLESPEQGATILLRVAALGSGEQWQLSGPGIAHSQTLAISGLNPDWIDSRKYWNEGFPLGVDLILLDRTGLVALPRTTHIKRAAQLMPQGEH